MRTHVVQPGDSIATIAAANGHFPGTIWDHPDNDELRELRGDPNVLLPGDRVLVPDIEPEDYHVHTGARHTFRRHGVPIPLRIRLMDGTKPRANLRYRLVVGGQKFEGSTDGDGAFEHNVPPVPTGELTLLDLEETFTVRIGYLDPVESDSGLRARLQNLRYAPENPSPAAMEAALERFQREHGLEITGEADGDTLGALLRAHGC